MIKKKIKMTTITAYGIIVVNGKIDVSELPPVVTTKNVTEKNVYKIYKNKSGYDGDFRVTDFKTETVTFTIDDETFMKYATVTE